MANSKNKTSDIGRLFMTLGQIFLTPFVVMLGVGDLGWHWSYWLTVVVALGVTMIIQGAVMGGIVQPFDKLKEELDD